MIDVGDKRITRRECVARGEVRMARETLSRILAGEVPKGDVLTIARVAGVQAAKRTAEWIPLAHPLPLDVVQVELRAAAERPSLRVAEEDGNPRSSEARLQIEARVGTHARTGVEMEALVAVTAAALTVYDLCKPLDRGMSVEAVRLVRKTGGKSGAWVRPGEEPGPGGTQARRRAKRGRTGRIAPLEGS